MNLRDRARSGLDRVAKRSRAPGTQRDRAATCAQRVSGLRRSAVFLSAALALGIGGCATVAPTMMTLDYHTPVDPALQAQLDRIDTTLRARYGLSPDQAAVGLLDLRGRRLALLHPDREAYAASVPKIAILLAYFQLHPAAATNLDAATRHELGLMIKVSSNELATRFAMALGIKPIQQVLDSYHFYNARRGGGLWFGKYYGRGGERFGDPVADHSHAATVRQLLRFYLLLDQGKLVSPAASKTMLEIFASPDIPADNNKFVRGLTGRDVQVLRKSGSWEDWLHDTALISGPGRRYILAALTHHPKGDDYLADLASAVDDLMVRDPGTRGDQTAPDLRRQD